MNEHKWMSMHINVQKGIPMQINVNVCKCKWMNIYMHNEVYTCKSMYVNVYQCYQRV